MREPDVFYLSYGSLRSYKMRTALTITGIAVGIAAVVMMTALGEGVRRFVLAEFTQFGTNIIAITPGKATTFGMSGATISSVRPLTTDDANALYRIREVTAVVPVIQGNAQVEYQQRTRRTTIIGVGADMPEVWQMKVSIGRFLPPDGFDSARAFAVIGAKMRDELFRGENPLGARMRIGSDSFRIIGVMAEKGQLLGFDLDDTVFVPVGKASDMFNREGLMEIDITYEEELSSTVVAATVTRRLIARHGQEDFTITTQDKMLEVLDSVLQLLTIGVAAIGGISLIVGVVGVATIMTIAVTERTPEIGLMRALGAKRRDVIALFLAEAAMLGAVGGAIGIVASLIIVYTAAALLPGFPISILGRYVAGAFVMATLLGGCAGLIPAFRAARMDPVEALRAE